MRNHKWGNRKRFSAESQGSEHESVQCQGNARGATGPDQRNDQEVNLPARLLGLLNSAGQEPDRQVGQQNQTADSVEVVESEEPSATN